MTRQYHILLTFPGDDNFVRILSIRSDASAKELHNLILSSVNYPKDTIASFVFTDSENTLVKEFICDESFLELSQEEGTETALMEQVSVAQIFEKKEELDCLYLFDVYQNRGFTLELYDTDSALTTASVLKAKGEAPELASDWDLLENMSDESLFFTDEEIESDEGQSFNEESLYDITDPFED